ncbi:MAG: hypothetical protein V9G20_27305 [Candidatus Promineifilaceae bacterium]
MYAAAPTPLSLFTLHPAKPLANEMGTAAAPIPIFSFHHHTGPNHLHDGNRGRTHSHFSLFTATPGKTIGKW